MDNDELMELAEVLYEAWRSSMHRQTSMTLWPWSALHVWEQSQWFTIAVAATERMAEMGQLRAV